MFNNTLRGANMTKRIVRRSEVRQRGGRSNSSLHMDIANGLFPPPVAIGARAVGWPEDEVDAVIVARIAGKSPEEIRALVRELVTARKAAN